MNLGFDIDFSDHGIDFTKIDHVHAAALRDALNDMEPTVALLQARFQTLQRHIATLQDGMGPVVTHIMLPFIKELHEERLQFNLEAESARMVYLRWLDIARGCVARAPD